MNSLGLPEVNATAVIERPLNASTHPSLLNSLFGSGKAKPTKPVANLTTEAVITIRDFAGYISLVKKARRDAGLPEEDDLEDVSSGSSESASSSAARWRAAGVSTFTPMGDAFEVVPPYFFVREFRLSDPAIMREIFQPSRNLDEIQDGLSVLLDTVECQLLDGIRARSKQFFEALSSLQELRDRVLDGNIAATALKRQLERVRDESCIQPLSVIILHRRKSRAESVRELMVHMHEAMTAPATTAALYNAGDWLGALEAIRKTTDMISSKLSGVHAVAGIRRRLEEFGKLIAGEISDRFAGESVAIAVLGDTSVSASSLQPTDGSTMLSSPAPFSSLHAGPVSAIAALESSLQARVRPLVDGLTRTKRLGQALDKLQASLVNEIRDFIRTDVDEAVYAELWASGAVDAPSGTQQSSSQPQSQQLVVTADKIQGLPAQTFLKVFTSVTNRVLELISRLQGLHDFLERCLDAQGRQSGPTALQGVSSFSTSGAQAAAGASTAEWESVVSGWRAQSGALVAVGVDASSRHLSKLLGIRREGAGKLKLSDLRALYDAATAYSTAANMLQTQSVLSGGSSASGSSALPAYSSGVGAQSKGASFIVQSETLEHAKAWIAHARERNVATLAQLCDTETWKQATVPSQVQAIASAIEGSVRTGGLSGSMMSPHAAFSGQGGHSGEGVGPHQGDGASAAHVGSVQAAAGSAISSSEASSEISSDTILIGGNRYPIVTSGVMLIKMLGDFAGVAEALPETAAEAIAATAELLREFNARATSLVLGAGAINTGSLKKITAKHLALTLQTLSGLLALLPSVRALLLMRLPPQQHMLLSDLAAVTADVLSHENRLRAKFVAIVKDLLVKCCHDMRSLPLGDPHATLATPTGPMLELSKGLLTLHRILSGCLRAEQLEDVTGRLLVMVNSYLPGQMQAILSHASLAAQGAMKGADGAVGAGTGGFSRDLMLTRLGADISCLLRDLDSLVPDAGVSAHSSGGGGSDVPGSSYTDSSASASSASSAGLEALQALARWAGTAFPGMVYPSRLRHVLPEQGASPGAAAHAGAAHEQGQSQASSLLTAVAAADANVASRSGTPDVHVEDDSALPAIALGGGASDPLLVQAQDRGAAEGQKAEDASQGQEGRTAQEFAGSTPAGTQIDMDELLDAEDVEEAEALAAEG